MYSAFDVGFDDYAFIAFFVDCKIECHYAADLAVVLPLACLNSLSLINRGLPPGNEPAAQNGSAAGAVGWITLRELRDRSAWNVARTEPQPL
jgi:hypothetical protein